MRKLLDNEAIGLTKSEQLVLFKEIDSSLSKDVKHPLSIVFSDRKLPSFFLKKDYSKLIKDEIRKQEACLDNSSSEPVNK